MDPSHESTTASSSDREIITTRIMNAHQDLVFKAWADPEHLKNWWGPKGFTNTFYEFDLQPGGKWRFTMHGPDKGNYENESEFIQIAEPDLIILNHISEPKFQLVATFSERPGHKTELTFKQIFEDAETCNKIRALVVPANEENFDRLEAELLKMSPQG